MSDFPDEWFRPAAGDDAQQPQGAAVDAAGDDAGGGRGQEERFTEQFKPGYVAHAPRQQPAAAPPREPGTDPAAGPREATTSHSVGVAPAADEQPPSRPGRLRWLPMTLAGLALLGTGIVVGDQLRDRTNSSLTDPQGSTAPLASQTIATTDPTPAASSSPSGSPSAPGTPWPGPVRTVRAQDVVASCTAPPQPGYDGATVSSNAIRVLDGDLATGWRCDDTAVGETLTFTFPQGTRLVGVRMTNGYTKSVNGGSLYPQYRRVTRVSWSFPGAGDAWFEQRLRDGVHTLQETRIPPTDAGGGLRMAVEETTSPGRSDASRNALVVTEVEFLVAD